MHALSQHLALLRTALQRIAVRGAHSLPVVDPENPNKLLGLVSNQDIHIAYDRALLGAE